ncbi:MAG: hypothetical protein KA250_13960 [Verrucomicrobiales bacterium]|jgi:hypothetical protein|nr:hypothetical protein [Verrucomicrobiales bacterium]MBP9226174.1 hypothetical protein [Verrucomicrobiales bacterium]
MIRPSAFFLRSFAALVFPSMWIFSASSQEVPVTPPPVIPPTIVVQAPMKLDISRRDYKNFLTDEEVLAPYRTSKGENKELKEVFVIGALNGPFAVFWDPHACRLLGVLNLAAAVPATPVPSIPPAEPAPPVPAAAPSPPVTPPSPFPLIAAGPAPLSPTTGAAGAPKYFGFRLIGGIPEFLYTLGSIAVQERLWLDDGGATLYQHFAVKDDPRALKIVIPQEWKDRVEVTVGTWEKNTLSVPKENSHGIVLKYRLSDPVLEPATTN